MYSYFKLPFETLFCHLLPLYRPVFRNHKTRLAVYGKNNVAMTIDARFIQGVVLSRHLDQIAKSPDAARCS